jgi:UDP-3-O-acyl-N-acetylglucosamine deacetylase
VPSPIILTSSDDIERLTRRQDFPPFRVPENWRTDLGCEFLPHTDYTVDEHVAVSGKSTFGDMPTKVAFDASKNGKSQIGYEGCFTEVDFQNARSGRNNIHMRIASEDNSIRDIAVVEHALSLLPGLGLRTNISLFGGTSFPSFDDCVGVLLKSLTGHLVPCGPAQYMTVKQPVAVSFPNGGYFVLNPDEGEKKLIIDHRIDHPKNVLGKQRVLIEIDPAAYAYIACARPPSYGFRGQIFKALTVNRGQVGLPRVWGLPKLGLDAKNVLIVEKKRLFNPEIRFNTGDDPRACGYNREALMHEVIDRLGAIALIPGRFVGKVTTFFVGHKHELEALKYLQDYLIR